MKTFPKRLKELRLKNHISQSKLAEELSVSNRTISMYEQGNSSPNIETLAKIASCFNVTMDYLAGVSDVKNTNPDVLYMSKYLGLSERAINELSFYSQLANSGDQHIIDRLETLNSFFEPNCDVLRLISDYLHFSATHFKNFYDNSSDALTPISELALWDDFTKSEYSDDWDLWSSALLLLVNKQLERWRSEIMNKRYTELSKCNHSLNSNDAKKEK